MRKKKVRIRSFSFYQNVAQFIFQTSAVGINRSIFSFLFVYTFVFATMGQHSRWYCNVRPSGLEPSAMSIMVTFIKAVIITTAVTLNWSQRGFKIEFNIFGHMAMKTERSRMAMFYPSYLAPHTHWFGGRRKMSPPRTHDLHSPPDLFFDLQFWIGSEKLTMNQLHVIN